MRSSLPFSSGRLALAVLLALVLALAPPPASSYLSEFTRSGGSFTPDHWDFNAFHVQWNLNPATSGAKISGRRPVAAVIQAAFDTWTSAPNTSLPATRGANSDVSSENNSAQTLNLICFVCADADFTKDAETLAVTITTTADVAGEPYAHGTTSFAGQILKADILFNPTTAYSTDGTGGEDLQTIATHEIGHFFGLDHSGVVHAVMFPFAPPMARTLGYDDVAGISSVNPKAVPDVATGSISGSVRMTGGSPVFAAHVFADSITGALAYPANIRKTPISTLTRPDGTYLIAGLPADSYTVTAEPLDGPVTAGDVPNYASAFGSSVQTNFTTRWH